MQKSISLIGGRPGNSSGKTSLNSLLKSFLGQEFWNLISKLRLKNLDNLFFNILLAVIAEIKFGKVNFLSLSNVNHSNLEI